MKTFDYRQLTEFNWDELNGKTLKISIGLDVTEDLTTTCVMGEDEKTGKHYLLGLYHEENTRTKQNA